MSTRNNLTVSPLGAILSFGISYLYYLAIHAAQGLEFLAVSGAVVLHFTLLYVLASKYQKTYIGEWMRGAMVGLNAGLNGILLHIITGNALFSLAISGVLLLAASLHISRTPVYHTILGWINWFLPMSWLVNLPGTLIYLVNLLAAPIGYLHPMLRGLRIRLYIDLPSCTFTVYGGLIRPFKGFSGLNMGNFIFINPGWEHLLKHEIGHLFSLAALGSVFHYIGGIDENYLQENYWEAYAEYLAESYSKAAPSTLSMWK